MSFEEDARMNISSDDSDKQLKIQHALDSDGSSLVAENKLNAIEQPIAIDSFSGTSRPLVNIQSTETTVEPSLNHQFSQLPIPAVQKDSNAAVRNNVPLEHVRGTISAPIAAPSDSESKSTSSVRLPSDQSTTSGAVNTTEPKNSLEALRLKYARDTSRLRILEVIHHTAVKNGDPEAIPSVPWVGGSPIDISHLFMLVISRGGFEKLESSEQWGEIAKLLWYDSSPDTNTIDILRATYQRTLLTFERQMHAKKNNSSEKRSRSDNSGNRTSTDSSNASKSGSTGNASTKNDGPNRFTDSNSSDAPSASRNHIESSDNPSKKARLSTGVAKVTSFDSKAPSIQTAPPAPVAEKIKEFVYPTTKKRGDKEIILDAIQDISSKNMNDVIKGLNSISVRSVEADHRSLVIENNPNILIALGELMDIVNPFPAKYFANILERDKDSDIAISVAAPGGAEDKLFADWKYISDVRCCEAANEAIIGYSAPILAHLVYILLDPPVQNKSMPECVGYSLDILTNIGRQLDVTGKKRKFNYDCWLTYISEMESEDKDLVLSRCTKHFSLRSTKLYRAASRLIFPRLLNFLLSNDRDYIVKSVECFGRLCFVQDNIDLLNPELCPELPDVLIELLRIGSTFVDQMTCYSGRLDHDEALNWSSKPAAVVGLFSEQCDTAIRDFALHVIYSLVCLSLGWRRAVAHVSFAVQTLRRIALSQPKSEHTTRAAEIIRVLTMDPDNQLDILRFQKDLCIAALTDETCADAVLLSDSKFTGMSFFTTELSSRLLGGSHVSVSEQVVAGAI